MADLIEAATTLQEQEKLELESLEIKLLTEGMYEHYGFDFRDYSLPSLKRRIWKRVYAEGLIKVIVEEAGGRFSTISGQTTANGGSAVSTNALLHEPVLAALR